MKYKTKPVEIEAVEWTGQNLEEILTFIQDGKPDFSHLPLTGGNVRSGVGYSPVELSIDIPTLEGDMRASKGDYIIKGLKGEFYPCKPDIFKMKYELLSTNQEKE